MRIGIDISVLNEEKRTGIAVYVYELVSALLRHNQKDQFLLFAISPFQAVKVIESLEFKKYKNVEIKIIKIPARLFRRIFLLWQVVNWPPIDYLVKNTDVFHSFNWYLPPKSKLKMVATVFDLTSLLFPSLHHDRTVQLDRIRFERIRRYADLVLTISESSKKDFLRLYPGCSVEVVNPGASSSFKRANNKGTINKVLQKYGLSPNYYLSVASLEPRKNLTALIKAYMLTNLTDPLVLVGAEGWKNKEIVELAQTNYPKIKLIGFVPEDVLPILYQNARCLVYPSLYEGFGMPVLEAMQSGVAVITSNVSSLPEVGGDGVYYVSPYDINSIKNGIIKITTDRNLRKRLIINGLKQAHKFSWIKSAERLNQLYQKLCN